MSRDKAKDLTPPTDRLLAHFKTMTRIREFEIRVAHHFRQRDIHGVVHTSLGQEAVAAGVCASLRDSDFITTTHRGHGHCIAKGADPAAMVAELFGRATGICKGKGGSMHIAATDKGILGANGIVGAGIPIAVGAGLAARSRGEGAVAVAFFGEGAVHTGACHEGLVLAVAWNVPVIFVCENNEYAEFTRSEGTWGGPPLLQRAAGYGLPVVQLDGNDVVAVQEGIRTAVETARAGGGPTFVEARTYRLSGHYEGDPEPYRDAAELEERKRSDPLTRTRAQLREAGTAEADLDAIERAAVEEMDAAVELAKAAPYPDPSTVLEDIGG